MTQIQTRHPVCCRAQVLCLHGSDELLVHYVLLNLCMLNIFVEQSCIHVTCLNIIWLTKACLHFLVILSLHISLNQFIQLFPFAYVIAWQVYTPYCQAVTTWWLNFECLTVCFGCRKVMVNHFNRVLCCEGVMYSHR